MSVKSVEAMSAAWDEAETAPEEASEAAPVEASPNTETEQPSLFEEEAPDSNTETAEEKAQRTRDEAGRFAKEEKAKAKAPPAVKATVKPTPRSTATQAPLKGPGTLAKPPPAPEAAAAATPPPGAAQAASTLKPPPGWKPTAREHWPKLPPEVQQEALRRDKEAAAVVTKLAEAEKREAAWGQTLAPYQALMASSGAPPQQVVGSMLRVAHTLAYGALPHKAQTVAHLMKSYGLATQDGLNALAAALDGQPVPQGQASQPVLDAGQLAQQVEARVRQTLQQERQQALYAREAQELESWAQDKEFLDDVREEMADILEVAAKRGLRMTRDEAYNRACMLHPDIAPVLKQREAAKLAAENAAKVQRSRAAASSVRGSPAVGEENAQPKSRRDVIAAAYEAATR